MKNKFFGISNKQRKGKFIKLSNKDGKCFKITSDIAISREEVDKIVDIVIEKLKLDDIEYGVVIANEIVETVTDINASRVNGGQDGETWIIELSANPFKF